MMLTQDGLHSESPFINPMQIMDWPHIGQPRKSDHDYYRSVVVSVSADLGENLSLFTKGKRRIGNQRLLSETRHYLYWTTLTILYKNQSEWSYQNT